MNFNPHLVTLRQLQYIVAVAECLSFNRAAQECHVSQPSLSAQIAEVERLLGVKLFERDRRRVLLTAAGRDFVTQARAVLRESDALAEAARRFIDPLSGTLRFGVIPTISPYFLSRLTPMLHSAFPGLRVLWLEEKTRPLMSRLDAGEIDAALVAFEADLGEVNREVIGKDPFVLVAPRGNPLAAGDGPVKLSELRNEDIFILTDDHCFGKQALALCMNAKARDHEFKATSLATILKQVAAAGHTIGSHTWSHKDLQTIVTKKGVEDAKTEIEMGISAVHMAVGGPTAPFFRFPALRHPPEMVSYLGERNIAIFSTDFDSFDFKLHKPEQVVKSIFDKLAKNGKGIILMHDFQKGTSIAIPEILAKLKAGGFKVVHMVPKDQVQTVAQYDEMVNKTEKLPTLDQRPTSSIVTTVPQ